MSPLLYWQMNAKPQSSQTHRPRHPSLLIRASLVTFVAGRSTRFVSGAGK